MISALTWDRQVNIVPLFPIVVPSSMVGVGNHSILILIFFYCYRDSRPITNHITWYIGWLHYSVYDINDVRDKLLLHYWLLTPYLMLLTHDIFHDILCHSIPITIHSRDHIQIQTVLYVYKTSSYSGLNNENSYEPLIQTSSVLS